MENFSSAYSNERERETIRVERDRTRERDRESELCKRFVCGVFIRIAY